MPKIDRPDHEWREQLTPEQYHVTREKGTEPPFTGAYYANSQAGTYLCVCCGAQLFSSDTKYDSGSGWPSFWEPVDPSRIEEHDDRSLMMKRIEATCSQCGAHLGHVFPDGPDPTGTRYCINSAALAFEPEPGAQ